MKELFFISMLSLNVVNTQAYQSLSQYHIEQNLILAEPLFDFTTNQPRFGEQIVDIRDRTMVLNLYSNFTKLDTIIEKGKYQIFIKHNRDIEKVIVLKNNKKIRRVVIHDNKANSLYKGLRSKLIKPILSFNQNTIYRIEIYLNGEFAPRIICVQTCDAETPKLLKEELGIPL